MSKFKVKFKIQALELEVEGERDSIPQVASAVKSQMAALLSAPQEIAIPGNAISPEKISTGIAESKSPKRRSARSGVRSGNGSDTKTVEPVDFRHDPSAWGNPKQTWSTGKKAIWLLYVCESQQGPAEMSGPTIVATFNKHFRQSGQLTTGNVNRDLGVLKGKSPSQIGEDATKEPSAWFLTTEGKTSARKLVQEALGLNVDDGH